MIFPTSGGALSGAGGGSKRKSRNPTRIHQGNNVPQRSAEGNNDEEGFSSDDDDEGFENPLDDDDDDDLDDIEDHDNDQDGNGASGPPGGNNPGSGSGKNSYKKGHLLCSIDIFCKKLPKTWSKCTIKGPLTGSQEF